MGKMNILSFKIGTVPQGKMNAGNKYAVCELMDCDDPFNDSLPHYVVLSQKLMPIFEKAMAAANNDEIEAVNHLPDAVKCIYGTFEDYIPAENKPFIKRYLNDGTRRDGSTFKKGEVVNVHGIPRLYKSLTVFCRRYYDSVTGRYEFAQHCKPQDVGDQQFPLYCEFPEGSETGGRDDIDKEAENAINNQNAEPPKPDEEPRFENGKPMNEAARKLLAGGK